MGAPNFREYDDPARAERIFKDYSDDIARKGALASDKALEVVRQNKTCEGLDLALDRLVSGRKVNHIKPASREYDERSF